MIGSFAMARKLYQEMAHNKGALQLSQVTSSDVAEPAVRTTVRIECEII